MKRLIFLLGGLILFFWGFNCSSSKNQLPRTNDKDCKEYYQFVKDNWIIDGSFVFSFKGNPIYWTQANEDGSFKNNNQEIYFKEKCLIGLSKKEIFTLFGEPTREAKNLHFNLNLITYCLQEECRDNKQVLGLTYGGIFFEFDKEDKVTLFRVRPRK